MAPIAAAVSVTASSSTANLALAGGGADSRNIILGKTNAYIVGSTLGNTINDVTLLAEGKSEIEATVVAIAASASPSAMAASKSSR